MPKGSYCYPNTSDDLDRKDVLRNRFGLETHSALRVEEYRATAVRMAEIAEGDGPKGNFDKDHLKALHAYIFQDVYEWAGHMRNESPVVDGERVDPIGELGKGGTSFLHGSRLDMGLNEALKPIRDPDILRGSSVEEFADRAGQVLGELNYVHPFREGNGRTQETFITELGRAYGHDVDLTVITKPRMIEASKEATSDPSSSAMRDLILDATDLNRREALRDAFAALKEQGENPFEHDVRSARPGEEISGQILDHTAMTATLVTDRGIVVVDRADLPDRLPDDDADITVKASSNFSRHADAREYLSASRQDAASNPALRNALSLEAYIERKLRDQYRDDPIAVERGLDVARMKIAGMIARGNEIEAPKVREEAEKNHETEIGPEQTIKQNQERDR